MNKEINTIFILADIQESLITDIEQSMKRTGELRFDVKHHVKQIKNHTRQLVQMVNQIIPEQCDNFAHDADMIRKMIDELK